jgi:hypothetical protein
MWLENLLSLLLYAPLLVPVLLLFIYAFGRPRAVNTSGPEVAEGGDELLAGPEH